MPWLPMYVDRTDIHRVLALLNGDNDVAFIVKDGPKRWKATLTLDQFDDARYCIWVRSGGALPLMRSDGSEDDPRSYRNKSVGQEGNISSTGRRLCDSRRQSGQAAICASAAATSSAGSACRA